MKLIVMTNEKYYGNIEKLSEHATANTWPM